MSSSARRPVRTATRRAPSPPLLSLLPLLLLAAGASACAGRRTPPPEEATPTRPKQQLVQVEGVILRLQPTAVQAVEYDVDLPAERTWALLPVAYDALGLPLSLVDPQHRVLGAGKVRAQGRLAGTWLSRYVECGTSVTGLPNADSFVVTLDVQTQVTSSGDGARAGLATAVQASGRPANVASNNAVNCVSTGALERRIADVVKVQDLKAP